jgi:hypothetical protein
VLYRVIIRLIGRLLLPLQKRKLLKSLGDHYWTYTNDTNDRSLRTGTTQLCLRLLLRGLLLLGLGLWGRRLRLVLLVCWYLERGGDGAGLRLQMGKEG